MEKNDGGKIGGRAEGNENGGGLEVELRAEEAGGESESDHPRVQRDSLIFGLKDMVGLEKYFGSANLKSARMNRIEGVLRSYGFEVTELELKMIELMDQGRKSNAVVQDEIMELLVHEMMNGMQASGAKTRALLVPLYENKEVYLVILKWVMRLKAVLRTKAEKEKVLWKLVKALDD